MVHSRRNPCVEVSNCTYVERGNDVSNPGYIIYSTKS